MTEELKPCPFKHADGDVVLTIFDSFRSHVGPYKKGEKLYKGEYIQAVCEFCDARGPIALTARDAAKEWNRRAEPVVSKMEITKD